MLHFAEATIIRQATKLQQILTKRHEGHKEPEVEKLCVKKPTAAGITVGEKHVLQQQL